MKLDGKLVSNELVEELKGKLSEIDAGLCVIQIGNDFSSNSYIKQKKKMAEKLGVNFKLLKFDSITTEELASEIDKLNEDSKIDGIIVQLPLPDSIDYEVIRNRINPTKDIDGVNDINIGKLVSGSDCLVPCTALGIVKLLDYYNIDLEGKSVCLCGRSIHIGKALVSLLTKRNATVTLCHSKTKNLDFYTKNSDIVVTGVGKAKFIKQDMVRDDVTLIDVGFNYLDGKACGDVDSDLERYQYLSPVPGGVGPMTVCSIYDNLYKAYLENHKEKEDKKKEDNFKNLGISEEELVVMFGNKTFEELKTIREEMYDKIRNERSLLLSSKNSEKYREEERKNIFLNELKKDVSYMSSLVLKALEKVYDKKDIDSIRVYLDQYNLFIEYREAFNNYFMAFLEDRPYYEVSELRLSKDEIKDRADFNNRQYVKK